MAAASAFRVPKDGEIFVASIRDRCQQLISAGVWEGLELVRLQAWLNNFEGPTETYFAACILDALVYRSNEQTVALMHQQLERTLPDHGRRCPPPIGEGADWLALLRTLDDGPDPRIRLVPVIRQTDSPTKSGPLVARMYRRRLRLNDRWMIWPWQIGEAHAAGATTFVFIDDFLGTGRQFRTFATIFKLSEQLAGAHAVYAPLVAHARGLRYVGQHVPSVHVCAVETLGDAYNLFHSTSRWFRDGVNTPEGARQFYVDLLARRGLNVSQSFRNGFGRLALAYSFAHAIPNNCLPVFWYRSPIWEPLIER